MVWYCTVNLRYSLRTFDLALQAFEQQQQQQQWKQHTPRNYYETFNFKQWRVQQLKNSSIKNTNNKQKQRSTSECRATANKRRKASFNTLLQSTIPITGTQHNSTQTAVVICFSVGGGEGGGQYFLRSFMQKRISLQCQGLLFFFWLDWMFSGLENSAILHASFYATKLGNNINAGNQFLALYAKPPVSIILMRLYLFKWDVPVTVCCFLLSAFFFFFLTASWHKKRYCVAFSRHDRGRTEISKDSLLASTVGFGDHFFLELISTS